MSLSANSKGKKRKRNGKNMIPTSTCKSNDQFSVLIVGAGLTGAICCHQLRQLTSEAAQPVRIEVIDMARGAGGRMSTTRQTIGQVEAKGNTGAQYASCCSAETKRVLLEVCDTKSNSNSPLQIQEIKKPVERSLHFPLHASTKTNTNAQYTHYTIPGGTNNLVKQFLYAGQPDVVSFETRLTKLWKKNHNCSNSSSQTKMMIPEFDLRAKTVQQWQEQSLSNQYDVVILALPPKDAVKFFATNNPNSNSSSKNTHDPQSQADLHRRYNKSKNNNPHLPPTSLTTNSDRIPVSLDTTTRNKLRKVEYVGRYSLALWFKNNSSSSNTNTRAHFAHTVFDNFQQKRNSDNKDDSILDAVFLQEHSNVLVLVAQSTVALWRKYSGVSAGGGRGGGKQKAGQSAGNSLSQISGGGRQAVRTALTMALEDLASATTNSSRRVQIPKVEHAKLLNWRTSQVKIPLLQDSNENAGVLATENGHVIFTGDWCIESSLEGCYRAAVAAANLALRHCQEHAPLSKEMLVKKQASPLSVPIILQGEQILQIVVGTIDKWVASKRFGFATSEDGQRYYVNGKQFVNKTAVRNAAVGVELRFVPQAPSNGKGCPEAMSVELFK